MEKIYRLMNHDSNADTFGGYTIDEYNDEFGTSYKTIEEAIDSDPEYLFDCKQMIEWTKGD